MLTGPWGTGKSYYIQNELKPFLEKKENGGHSCVIVSLYGLKDTAEISKSIYLGTRMKFLTAASENSTTVTFAGETIIKGIAGAFGVDLSVSERSLKRLYASVNLTGKLVILEDLERSGIDILEVLGYVNNLVEQDGVKVLLVANEEEIIKYELGNKVIGRRKKEEIEEEKKLHEAFDVPFENKGEIVQCRLSEDYQRLKEKTISDTIEFKEDYQTAIREIVQMFDKVESVLAEGEQEDIFSPEFYEKLSDIKMPASKLELLIKTLKNQIIEYNKTNQVAAKKFHEMLEKTIAEYHQRRKQLTSEEAGETQEQASEDIIRSATEQALKILQEINESRESFRKVGLTFEEKAFYDILIALRDHYNFEYGQDKVVNGITVNDKCKALAKKVKDIIDTKSSFADWLNNQIVRDQLKFDIKVCLIKNGYPPQYSPEVFQKVMEQVENFEENNG